jgi:aminopeptidase
VDDGARRLGEVALVDREGRIGPLGTVFYNTLLDENAASHLALGGAYETLVGEEDVPRINRSELHLDFMIGSDDVAVTGITRDGSRVPILRDGSWQV